MRQIGQISGGNRTTKFHENRVKMKMFIKAYWRLLFPRVPESTFTMPPEKMRRIVKEVARGNPSLQAGKYITYADRAMRKEHIVKSSFI
jgi:hypothetical protein